MKYYRCRHVVEAMQWFDTDSHREAFADWFDRHEAVFETRGPVVALPQGGEVQPGEWILLSDGDFIAMEHEQFCDDYAEVPQS